MATKKKAAAVEGEEVKAKAPRKTRESAKNKAAKAEAEAAGSTEVKEPETIIVSTDEELKKALEAMPELDEQTRNYIRNSLDLPEEPGVREERDRRQLERIRYARTYLTIQLPFLGFLVLHLALTMSKIQHRVPTAAITSTGIAYFNSRFVEGLTDEQLRGLVTHEVLHAALECFERRGVRNPKLWNMAHDYVVNDIIMEFSKGKKVALPPGGLYDAAFAGMAAEEVYDALLVRQQEKEAKSPKGKGKGTGKGKGKGAGQPSQGGTGSPGEGEEDDYAEGGTTGQEKGEGSLGSDIRDDLETSEDGRKARQGDENARARVGQSWKERLVQAEMRHKQDANRGSMPALLQKIINEISCPLVPWAEHLSRWIGENGRKLDVTFAKRSRRQEAVAPEIVLPGKKRTGYPEVTILWDTSGSMNGTETKILAEVSGIIDGLGLRVRLIVCDCAIHADLEGLEDTRQVFESVIGGGGSSFCPAFERLAVEGNNSVVVAFTDGYIDVPSTQPPDLNGVLWVITEGGQRPAPWGVGLRIDEKGYGTIE